MGAGIVFMISAISMWTYMRRNAPGIAYTYCWLFCCFLSSLTESKDALALSFCIGFGLNVSWYTTQLVDSLLWSNLIPFWHEYFPHWCTETLIRMGDIMLHPLPLYFLLPYHRFVTWRIGLYAFLLERWYFCLVEGVPIGTGNVVNIIYDFRPHLKMRSFLLSQYLTNLCYLMCTISQISYPIIRVPLQISLLSLFLFICIIHTDRWNNRKHELPELAGRFVGVAIEQPIAEEYALYINDYSRQLHQHMVERMEELMSPESRAQFLASFPSPAEMKADFWKALPQGLTMSHTGLMVEGISGVVVWDKLAAVVATLTCKLQSMKESVGIPELPSLELPSLEALQAALPGIESAELVTIRSILETVVQAVRPVVLVAEEKSTTPKIKVATSPDAKKTVTKEVQSVQIVDEIEPIERGQSPVSVLRAEVSDVEPTTPEDKFGGRLRQRRPLGDTLTIPSVPSTPTASEVEAVTPDDSSPSRQKKSDVAWAEAVNSLRRMLWPEIPNSVSEKAY